MEGLKGMGVDKISNHRVYYHVYYDEELLLDKNLFLRLWNKSFPRLPRYNGRGNLGLKLTKYRLFSDKMKSKFFEA